MQRKADPLDDIFNKALKGKTLFTDRSVLRSDYIPNNLLFREEQITSIGQALTPTLQNQKPSNLLLYGKTGSGKTAVAKHVLERIQETARQNNKTEIMIAYSNSRLAGSEYRTLVDLGQELGIKIPFTGLPLSEVLDRIYKHISKNNIKVIFILDEIDFLAKQSYDDILYSLTRSSEHLGSGFLSIIGISNDLHFKSLLDSRVLSSLNEEEILFHPYTVKELNKILEDRTKTALKEGTVQEGTLNLCAAMAGSEHGDARRAIELLRVAAEIAERENKPKITEQHVKTASHKIDRDRITQSIKTLPIHEKIVLTTLLDEKKGLATGEAYQKYLTLTKKIGLDSLTQRRVSGLINELDTQGLVSAKLVNHGRYGRTKNITLMISNETLQETIEEDELIGQTIQ